MPEKSVVTVSNVTTVKYSDGTTSTFSSDSEGNVQVTNPFNQVKNFSHQPTPAEYAANPQAYDGTSADLIASPLSAASWYDHERDAQNMPGPIACLHWYNYFRQDPVNALRYMELIWHVKLDLSPSGQSRFSKHQKELMGLS